jgi:predicted nucleic acid-binding protein
MKGVADSSPLHYLVQIKAEDVLRQLFVELITPPEVIAELTHPRAPDAVRLWATDPPSWLRVVPVRGGVDDLGLGPGESAAIALAIETHADTLLIDERAGTNVAKRRGIRTTGTLAILAMAAERKLVSLPDAFAALRATSFRGPDALMSGLLELDRERGGQHG